MRSDDWLLITPGEQTVWDIFWPENAFWDWVHFPPCNFSEGSNDCINNWTRGSHSVSVSTLDVVTLHNLAPVVGVFRFSIARCSTGVFSKWQAIRWFTSVKTELLTSQLVATLCHRHGIRTVGGRRKLCLAVRPQAPASSIQDLNRMRDNSRWFDSSACYLQ